MICVHFATQKERKRCHPVAGVSGTLICGIYEIEIINSIVQFAQYLG